MASLASSYVASEWPIETRMLWSVRAEMVGRAPGSSGASVTSLMGEEEGEEGVGRLWAP